MRLAPFMQVVRGKKSMKWIVPAITLALTGCSIHYSSPSDPSDGAELYRIDEPSAHNILKAFFEQKLSDGSITSLESVASGYMVMVKGIKTHFEIRPVNIGDVSGVMLLASGGGYYYSSQMVPKEFQVTMRILEEAKAELEKNSLGVVRQSRDAVVQDVYP
jgi:hypothetical protein